MSMTSSQYHGDGGDDQLWHPADFQVRSAPTIIQTSVLILLFHRAPPLRLHLHRRPCQVLARMLERSEAALFR